MHFVAGNAGKFAPAETGRRLQTIELSSGHPDHAIAPKPIGEKLRLGLADEFFLVAVIARVRLDDEALAKVAMSGPKDRALTIKIDLVGHVIEGPDAVALRAIQTRGCGREARGVGYSRVASRGQMRDETAKRIAIPSNVLASLAMARFARDAELRDAGVPCVAGDESRLPLRHMAIHTCTVPGAYGVIFLRVGRHQERLRHWRPHFFRDDVGERELLKRPAVARLDPENLQIVRACEKNDFARRIIFVTRGARAHDNFLALPFQFVIASIERELNRMIDAENCRRCRDLRHRPVKRSMPARVIIQMTRATGIRSHIISNARLNRPILRRLYSALEVAIGTKR